MPMAFASSIGGMMTLIGTPPILIVHNTLVESGHRGFSFFTTLPVGIILLFCGILLLWPLSKTLDKKRKKDDDDNRSTVKSPKQLVTEYRLAENMYRVETNGKSPVVGKKLSELDITKQYAVTIAEIRRRSTSPFKKTVTQELPEAGTVLGDNDVLYLIGDFVNVARFAEEKDLKFIDQSSDDSMPTFSGKLKFDEIGMAEVVVLANSNIIGHPVRESGFRKNYNVNIIGIQRKTRYLVQNVKDEKIQSGDMLLVQGAWEDIDRLSRLQAEIVVIGQPSAEASKVTLEDKAPVAGIIMGLMVVAMIFNFFPPVVAVLMAAVAMILAGCFRSVRDAYRTINWESVILFAAMMPLATAMEKTGASELISSGIVGSLGSRGPYLVLAGIYLGTSVLTMFISNTATAILFAPIALQAAVALGVSPYPFLVAVAVAASMCFASPFSTPPNAMVVSAGRYSFLDYVRVGLPLQVFYMVIMVFALPLVFPF
ncbi:MAG: SLC13 family permease, partial [Petrimonas sp.]|nr:SLC13 family permease [Petrimonas sp.]